MYRRNGHTTRLVDEAIQCFFTNKAIFFPVSLKERDCLRPLEGTEYHPYRHNPIKIIFSDGETIVEQSHAVNVFLRRLSIEHGLSYKRRRLPIGHILRMADFEQGKQNVCYVTFWDVLKMKFAIWKLKLKYRYGRI